MYNLTRIENNQSEIPLAKSANENEVTVKNHNRENSSPAFVPKFRWRNNKRRKSSNFDSNLKESIIKENSNYFSDNYSLVQEKEKFFGETKDEIFDLNNFDLTVKSISDISVIKVRREESPVKKETSNSANFQGVVKRKIIPKKISLISNIKKPQPINKQTISSENTNLSTNRMEKIDIANNVKKLFELEKITKSKQMPSGQRKQTLNKYKHLFSDVNKNLKKNFSNTFNKGNRAMTQNRDRVGHGDYSNIFI